MLLWFYDGARALIYIFHVDCKVNLQHTICTTLSNRAHGHNKEGTKLYKRILSNPTTFLNMTFAGKKQKKPWRCTILHPKSEGWDAWGRRTWEVAVPTTLTAASRTTPKLSLSVHRAHCLLPTKLSAHRSSSVCFLLLFSVLFPSIICSLPPGVLGLRVVDPAPDF